MIRPRQKHKLLEDIGNFMFSKGKLLDQREYSQEEDVPVRYSRVLGLFGTWTRMLNNLRLVCPDLYSELEKGPVAKPQQPKKPEAKPVQPKTVAKPVQPKKPVVGTTVKKEI